MKHPIPNREPRPWQLRWEIASTRALMCFAHPSIAEVFRPGPHLFLADCYGRLARYHGRLGHKKRAQELDRKAADHFHLGGGYDPPPAAAMAIGRQRSWEIVDAVAPTNPKGPNNVA